MVLLQLSKPKLTVESCHSEKSIRKVADAFVRPNCYSLDLDRLLLGREASLRTAAIGALHIKIHRAKGLRSSDVIGSSDPYCVIG